MTDDTLDRAVQAAAEALDPVWLDDDLSLARAARLAVEAAAPVLNQKHKYPEHWMNLRQRAERAEAEVEHWRSVAELKAQQAREEFALADRLAEALRALQAKWPNDSKATKGVVAALAAYEEARRP